MRAARYYGTEDVRIEEVDENAILPGEVRLQVAFNGLCGSDLHEYFDGPRSIPLAPHPLTGASVPVILGHEISGYVTDVGSGITDLGEGDLVAVEPLRWCGTCRPCRAGNRNLCDVLAFHGLSTGGGGLAEFTVVPRAMVHVLPRELDPRMATLVEPLAVAYHAVRRSGVAGGDAVIIHGAGPIGVAVLLTLRTRGIDALVIEPSDARREVVTRLGGTAIPPGPGLEDRIVDATSRPDADVSFDTAGAPMSFTTAVQTTAKLGRIMLMATPRAPIGSALGPLMAREIEVRSSFAYCDDFPPVIEAVADGRFPLDSWVSTMTLTDLVSAFELLRRGERVKVLIDPSR